LFTVDLPKISFVRGEKFKVKISNQTSDKFDKYVVQIAYVHEQKSYETKEVFKFENILVSFFSESFENFGEETLECKIPEGIPTSFYHELNQHHFSPHMLNRKVYVNNNY
jgi:hypothetical protein